VRLPGPPLLGELGECDFAGGRVDVSADVLGVLDLSAESFGVDPAHELPAPALPVGIAIPHLPEVRPALALRHRCHLLGLPWFPYGQVSYVEPDGLHFRERRRA
jgi:hypothetical protein